jgi:predicted dehydrogenase
MAVIGCGPIGSVHAQGIAGASKATLVAVCDPDADRRCDVAARFGAAAYSSTDELFEKEMLDAVTIATPDHLHQGPALTGIAAGCHVFCEKPLAGSVGEAEQMVAAAAERGVYLAVDYNRRFASGYRQAHDWFSQQRIGQLETAIVRVTDPTPPPKVARNPYVILTTLLTHHFDLVRWFGGEVRRLSAHADSAETSDLVREIDLTIELISVAQATIAARYRDDQPCTAEWMALHGSNGTIVVEDIARRAILSGNTADLCIVREADPTASDPIRDSVIAHVQAFIEHVVAGNKPPVSGHDGLAGMRLAAAAVESLTSGKTIEVESP